MARSSTPSKVHAHGCLTCHEWYEDTCEDKGTDAQCQQCITGKGHPLLRENRRPKDCCRAHSRLATKDEQNRYSLAGTGPWFFCTACGRTHPHRNPTKEYTHDRPRT